ncbi:VanZ family protein [Kitasatospora sp. NBC_01539]|uniref:VanZ family protein n=1 Tax=Kitasatospora sp. NBC_01539 TaxID=2903577 RepID=UPI0038601158
MTAFRTARPVEAAVGEAGGGGGPAPEGTAPGRRPGRTWRSRRTATEPAKLDPTAPGPATPGPTGMRPPLLQRRGPLAAVLRAVVLLVAVALTVLFAVALARATLSPSPASRGIAHTNLHPGASLRAYLDRPAVREAARQVGGNILLGAPFGVLLPLLSRRAGGLLRVTGLTVLTMATVEVAQAALVPGRAFDVDDVILNTGGALLLYLLVGRHLSKALYRSRSRPRGPAEV